MFRLTKKASLENVELMIDQILDQAGRFLTLTKKECNDLRMICEEILVNIARYAYEDSGDMTVEMEYDGGSGRLRLCFMDRGTVFNPLQRKEPDLTADAADRPIGGLGIFMVRKLSDSVSYERADGMNRLTVTKRYQGQN